MSWLVRVNIGTNGLSWPTSPIRARFTGSSRPGTPLTCKDGRNPSGGPAAPSPTATPRSPIDWNAIGRAMGSPLRTEEGDVHTAEMETPYVNKSLKVFGASRD